MKKLTTKDKWESRFFAFIEHTSTQGYVGYWQSESDYFSQQPPKKSFPILAVSAIKRDVDARVKTGTILRRMSDPSNTFMFTLSSNSTDKAKLTMLADNEKVMTQWMELIQRKIVYMRSMNEEVARQPLEMIKPQVSLSLSLRLSLSLSLIIYAYCTIYIYIYTYIHTYIVMC